MSDDVLDLLESAEEPAMLVDPERVIGAARRTRRRRRAGVLALGVVGVLGASGGLLTASGPWFPETALPAGPATTPAPSSPSPDATVPASGSAEPDAEADATRVRGRVHIMSAGADGEGRRPALYVTVGGMLCIGTVDGSGDVRPSVCSPAKPPPDDAFGKGFAWTGNGNLGPEGEPNEFAAGLVAEDVTRVVVRTERGDVTAHLATVDGLGRLYWAETHVPGLGPDDDGAARSRVAYRGAERAFSCGFVECITE